MKHQGEAYQRLISDASVQENLLDASVDVPQYPPTLSDEDPAGEAADKPQQQSLRRFVEGLLMSLAAGSCFGECLSYCWLSSLLPFLW